MEYMLHWWGGCQDAVKEKYGYDEYLYFNNADDRENVINNLVKFSNLGLAIDCKEGNFTHKDTIAKMVFKYQDKTYNYEYNFGKEYPEDLAHFMFYEGNYSCDCNKSLFIQRECDVNFPELGCGNNIEIVDFEVIYE